MKRLSVLLLCLLATSASAQIVTPPPAASIKAPDPFTEPECLRDADKFPDSIPSGCPDPTLYQRDPSCVSSHSLGYRSFITDIRKEFQERVQDCWDMHPANTPADNAARLQCIADVEDDTCSRIVDQQNDLTEKIKKNCPCVLIVWW